MGSLMSIDSDKVYAAANQIGSALEEIQTYNQRFLSILEDTNSRTQNKFALTVTLKKRVETESLNIKNCLKDVEAITQTLDAYAAQAAEASDDSEFRE